MDFVVDPDGLDQALVALTSVGVTSLTSQPPTLEELFLRHYGDEATRDARRTCGDPMSHARRHRRPGPSRPAARPHHPRRIHRDPRRLGRGLRVRHGGAVPGPARSRMEAAAAVNGTTSTLAMYGPIHDVTSIGALATFKTGMMGAAR